MDNDKGLHYLLDLDGEQFEDRGYTTKFKAWRVQATPEMPHGIRYSLTLHDASGKRLLGFDNAHQLQKSSRYAPRRAAKDHRHEADKVSPYHFQDAGKLMQDFWDAPNKIINEN